MPPKLHPSRLEQVSDAYEQRYLYKFGRYLWNFLGICGVAATGIGGVYAMSGEAFWIPGKEARILERKDSDIMNYPTWFQRECPNFGRNSFGDNSGERVEYEKRRCAAAFYIIEEGISGGTRTCYGTDLSGKKVGTGNFVNGSCDGYLLSSRFEDLLNKGDKLYEEYKDKEEAMVSKKAELIQQRSAKRAIGGLISVYGVGIIAMSGFNSALFAIERNSRGLAGRDKHE